MKIIQSIFLIIGIIIISSCSNDGVTAPSTDKISKISYKVRTMVANVSYIDVTTDSIYCRSDITQGSGEKLILDTIIYRKNILDSVLRTVNLDDAWNVSAPPTQYFYYSLMFYTKTSSPLAVSQDSVAKELHWEEETKSKVNKINPLIQSLNRLYLENRGF